MFPAADALLRADAMTSCDGVRAGGAVRDGGELSCLSSGATSPDGDSWSGGDAGFGLRLPVQGDRVELSYSVLDTAPVGMVLADTAGRLWWVNGAICRLLDRAREEVLELGLADLVHGEDWEAHEAMIANAGTRGPDPPSVEERWSRADGSAVWVNVSVSLATDPGGRPLLLGTAARPAVVIQVTNVSGRRAAEQMATEAQRELEQRNVELERSNQELAEFAYVISHDLSEPLRVIAGHVQLLAERYRGQLQPEADEWIDFAVDGAARQRALIDSLLAYSRVGHGGRPSANLDTTAVVHAAIAGLQVAIDAAVAVIDVRELPAVRGDATELGRVFANLIANAIKFRRPGVVPMVEVRGERLERECRFVVADNGFGIPQQHRERVFRLFQRLHRRGEYEGTGMGLAICRKVVERNGGRIWIDDAPEGGAAFWFSVPHHEGAV